MNTPRLIAAATESGVWTATSFSGDETLYSPASDGCEANTISFTVKSDYVVTT